MNKTMFAAATLALAAYLPVADACTAIVVGRKASATGRVIVGHNEDKSGTFVRHALVPRRDGRPAMFWSEVKNPAGGDKVSHFFFNEHGVMVLSNNAGVMSKWGDATYSLPEEGAASALVDGGLGYDLRILMIERAKTAAEGVRIMADLIEERGYSQMSRNFVIADRDEAWIFEAIKGRRFIARRVPDDEVVVYPNCLVFNKVREGDVVSRAFREKGQALDVIAGYQGPRTWKSPYNVRRWQELYRLAAGVDVKAGDEYPFSVKPAHPVSAADIKKGLGTHYEGTPFECNPRHPAKGPDVVEPICRAGTLESLVCEFGATPEETVLEMTLGRPCEAPYGVYRPFAGVLPQGAAVGDEALRRLENRCAPIPRSRVAVFVGEGPRGRGCVSWLQLVESSPELELVLVDAEMIRVGALDKVDVLVMPGGASSLEKRDLAPEGAKRIRDFIRGGGGYIGTCAGCCLALEEKGTPHCGISLIPFNRIGSKGGFMMPISLNDRGAAAMGMQPGEYKVRYHGGPVLVPSTNSVADAKVEVWGTYASDFDCPKSSLKMFGGIALVGGTYGKGRIFTIACHPESDAFRRDIVKGAFRFVLARPVTFPERIRAKKSYSVGLFSTVIGGVDTSRAILAINAMPGVDLLPLTGDEIEAGDLSHVDILVMPGGVDGFYKKKFVGATRELILAFAKAGGKVVAWGNGASYAPPEARVFSSSAEAVSFIASESKGER